MNEPTSPLDTLKNSLSLWDQWPTNAFFAKECQIQLEEVAKQVKPDQPLPQMNEESLLVVLARVSHSLAVHWGRLVGERAWEPTPATPYPLADLLEGPLQDTDLYFRVGGPGIQGGELHAFVEEGMRVAMPLRNSDVSDSRQLTENQRRALYAQEQIRRAAFGAFDWPISKEWVVEQIDLHDGAWVFSGSVVPAQETSYSNFYPAKKVVYYDANKSTVKVGRWQDFWVMRKFRKSEQVFPWLQRHGQDVQQLKRKDLRKQIHDMAKSRVLTLDQKWEKILERLEQCSDISLQHCPLTGLPYGLLALRTNGALLTAVLKKPPPCGLDAKGPHGHTIWDAVLFPEYPNEKALAAPRTALTRLMKKVPLTWGNPLGLMWEIHSPAWIQEFAQKTLMEHPKLWLGTPENAEKGAANTLVVLACGEKNAKHVLNAANSAAMLAKLWLKQSELFTPTLIDLLGAMRTVISTHPSRFVAAAKTVLAIHPPEPQLSKWQELVKPKLERLQGLYSGGQPLVLKSEEALAAMMLEHNLEIQLPASASPPRPRL